MDRWLSSAMVPGAHVQTWHVSENQWLWGGGGNNGDRLLPSLHACLVFQETPVGCSIIQNTGLDELSWISFSKAPLSS